MDEDLTKAFNRAIDAAWTEVLIAHWAHQLAQTELDKLQQELEETEEGE
jgi:hypothetical protein